MEVVPTTGAARPAPTTDKLYIENTLLRVAGALFCHDQRQAAKHTAAIELNRGVADKSIVIRPDPEFGQPGPLAHKLFIALIKKHSDYGRPVRSEVSFTKRELMRLIGRQSWGGRDSEQLVRALNEIHHTFIRTSFKTEPGRLAEHSFAIFPELFLERAETATDPIESCVVTLARPIIASLEDDHFTCLNHALMQRLGTIGQALVMRLFFHFANLYDGHHKSRLSFPKRYDAICAEWLGGLTVHTARSVIERDQLGPHLRQLVTERFLASCALADARNGDGFVITFRPGMTFFTDYDRFYRHRRQGGLQFEFHGDRRDIAEPLRVAHLFVEKRTGQALKAIPYVSSRDVETAREILKHIPFEGVADFLDFALSEARKTKFDVQTLGGLKQYLTDYVGRSWSRAAAAAAARTRSERDRETALRIDYDRFRRQAADALFATLPAAEQAVICGLARASSSTFNGKPGSMANIVLGIARARSTAERHPENIPTFEDWRQQRAA